MERNGANSLSCSLCLNSNDSNVSLKPTVKKKLTIVLLKCLLPKYFGKYFVCCFIAPRRITQSGYCYISDYCGRELARTVVRSVTQTCSEMFIHVPFRDLGGL